MNSSELRRFWIADRQRRRAAIAGVDRHRYLRRFPIGSNARHNKLMTISVEAQAEGRLRVLVLGSTGSIGTQALEVIAANPDRFEVVGLAAGGAQPGAAARASAPRPG